MLRKSMASIVLCILITCSCISINAKADAQVITISAANSAQTTDVVLVIDNSGSMKETDPVKKDINESVGTLATKMFINSTPLNGSKIGIVSFSAQLSDKKFRTENLFNVDDMNSRNNLLEYVDAIKNEGRSGGTNIPVGIAEAMNMLSQSKAGNKAIILITDGENDPPRDNVNPWENDPILKDLKDKNSIPIYAIGLNAGVPEDKKGEFKNYLNKIAQSTGNERVFTIDSIDSITQVIQEIDAMVYKAEKIVEFPVGQISIEMPENIKTCAMSFVSINNRNIDLQEIKNTKDQDVTDNKDVVYSNSIGSIANLTLNNPENGLWKVTVKGDEGDRVRVEWKVITTPTPNPDPKPNPDPVPPTPPVPNPIPWIPIIIALAILIAAIVAFIILHDKKLPQLPGYMKVLVRQSDGSMFVIQDWLELGTIKNSVKRPVTLGKISGMTELNKVKIGQGDYDYEITLNGQLPSYITGLQGGLNTDDSCTLIYEDGKQIEFTYKSFLC